MTWIIRVRKTAGLIRRNAGGFASLSDTPPLCNPLRTPFPIGRIRLFRSNRFEKTLSNQLGKKCILRLRFLAWKLRLEEPEGHSEIGPQSPEYTLI
jgi:hypothetical protein